MDNLFDDNELVGLLNEEQNLEIKELLQKFISSSREVEILKALEGGNQKLHNFTEAVSNLKLEPNVFVNQDQVIEGLSGLFNKIKTSLDNLKISNSDLVTAVKELRDVNKLDRVFEIRYGVLNRIEGITVKVKK